MAKKFMIYVTIEVDVQFARDDATLEDAYDMAHEYVTEDLGQIIDDMYGEEIA